MFNFTKGLYTDVRIEDVTKTVITYKDGQLLEMKPRKSKGIFIRVFDGQIWYYASLSNESEIQSKIDELSQMTTINDDIINHPIVKAFEVHQDTKIIFNDTMITEVPLTDKNEWIKAVDAKIQCDLIKSKRVTYVDYYIVKSFYSSLGSEIVYDNQTCGIRVGLELAYQNQNESDSFSFTSTNFDDLKQVEDQISDALRKSLEFVQHAKTMEPGVYPVVLSPLAAGVFAHESFGHKSEADFMVGDENMAKEWAIGKEIGPSMLTIIDDGHVLGNGYTPYDDEGTKANKTYLIKNGKLAGRLQSVPTAVYLSEHTTGNARAVNFEFEPIVRMTTTYFEGGDQTFEELIAPIKKGLFVDTIKHGSGMSTFTIAPSRAYLIEDGKIKYPVKVSVITGSVFETLGEIDGLSKDVELLSFVGGGCGKMEQYPLPVGFGGPFVRVARMKVQ